MQRSALFHNSGNLREKETHKMTVSPQTKIVRIVYSSSKVEQTYQSFPKGSGSALPPVYLSVYLQQDLKYS